MSFSLLLIAYACLGWFLANPVPSEPAWLLPTCLKTFDLFRLVLPVDQAQTVCGAVMRENLLGAVLAFSWILLASLAFMSPLTSFKRFIVRWFKSDTVAFLALCVIAGMITFILFSLQLFLQISAILASEALVRIDLQTLGFSKLRAFWILVLLSVTGLTLGWVVRLWF